MRASRKDCDNVVLQIQMRAKALGLLPPEAQMHFIPGSTANGHAPRVDVSSDGHRTLDLVSFLPDFNQGRNTTTTEAYSLLCATNKALAAVERMHND
ncbi:hypothetical protein PP641_gp092 [Arthrobacter phage SilentRX]|uniref:Uncharacterized protein n=1 Tax=Arthrobacter phage SilentRX TaxID=2836091 RepID=A0A8F3E8R4_9CAUD|nr:hypothetical protein PP641_gp092 [Arthrobacter phage SilentRX]QWY82832.1 hypothetical protein SEA_SILENTRX_92 [Arthrobacter phage SilentRX]